ncbi:hypothetical protein FBU59_002987 [Linderina macrospora]|uniref:Uncharacterized protein n=1 Tax=Linderina macrospora TaxID=4868 RepID=A0ACC1J9L8_9FUNG|nr:hypothetical protein FBU59_002987 [Linderina macrospora]
MSIVSIPSSPVSSHHMPYQFTYVNHNNFDATYSLIFAGQLENSMDADLLSPDFTIELAKNKMTLMFRPKEDGHVMMSGKYEGLTGRRVTLTGYGGRFKAERLPFGKRWTFCNGAGCWYNWYISEEGDDVVVLKDHNKNTLAEFRRPLFHWKMEGLLTIHQNLEEDMFALVLLTAKMVHRNIVGH